MTKKCPITVGDIVEHKSPKKKHWFGEVGKCDICKIDLLSCKFFYDAKTIYGPWGLLCPNCFKTKGCGLGMGLGQKYDSKPPHYKIGG